MKQASNEPQERTAARVARTVATLNRVARLAMIPVLAVFALVIWSTDMWLLSSNPKYLTYVIWSGLLTIAIYACFRIPASIIVLYLGMRAYSAPAGNCSANRGDVTSKYHTDEKRIREVLRKVEAEGFSFPPWVASTVDGWLAMPDGADKDRKRADLLTRLYSYSAFSHDAVSQRTAANRLRLAINPWADDEST